MPEIMSRNQRKTVLIISSVIAIALFLLALLTDTFTFKSVDDFFDKLFYIGIPILLILGLILAVYDVYFLGNKKSFPYIIWFASIVMPGLGHILLGKRRKGIKILISFLILLPSIAYLIITKPGSISILLNLVLAIVLFGIYFYTVTDINKAIKELPKSD